MRAPSKLDQLRAMREATHLPRPMKVGDIVVMPDGEAKTITAILPRPRKKTRKPKRADTVAGDTVSWLAPAGQCPHCDKRRAQLQATMRKRRAKK